MAALTSCGQSFSKPEDAARTFLSCLRTGDISGARTCLVEHEQAIARITPPTGPVEYEIGFARIKGDHAKVPVVVVEGSQRTNTYWMATRESGSWRLSIGMTVAGQMQERVTQEMNELGDDASDEERIDAMIRGAQGAGPGR